MKRLMLFYMIGAFVVASTLVSAQEKVPLENGNFAVIMDYINFTDGHFDDGVNEDDGVYVGLEVYRKINSNLYLGGEIGNGTNIELSGEEITFSPVELNLKYAKVSARNFVVDFGAGLSYSSVKIQNSPFFVAQEERSDWLFGAQIFADFNYIFNSFYIGANGKYQITEEFKNEGIDLSNYRLGVQFGMVF